MSKNNTFNIVLVLIIGVLCYFLYFNHSDFKAEEKRLKKIVDDSEIIIKQQDSIISITEKKLESEKKLKNNAIYRLNILKNKRNEVLDINDNLNSEQLDNYLTDYKSIIRR